MLSMTELENVPLTKCAGGECWREADNEKERVVSISSLRPRQLLIRKQWTSVWKENCVTLIGRIKGWLHWCWGCGLFTTRPWFVACTVIRRGRGDSNGRNWCRGNSGGDGNRRSLFGTHASSRWYPDFFLVECIGILDECAWWRDLWVEPLRRNVTQCALHFTLATHWVMRHYRNIGENSWPVMNTATPPAPMCVCCVTYAIIGT